MEEFRYTVLVYEDDCGLWLKVPEVDFQCCTDDLEVGLDVLEEKLDCLLQVPEPRVRTIRRVGKDEYGPTQVDVERERCERELREEQGPEQG